MSTSKLPLLNLDDIRIASPCPARWSEMTGNDQIRLCHKCEKAVYNLSEMTRDTAELLISRFDGPLCVRFYRRTDGMIQTADCPIGLREKLLSRLRRSAFVAAALSFAAGAFGSIWGGNIRMLFASQTTGALAARPLSGENAAFAGRSAVHKLGTFGLPVDEKQ